VAILSKNIFPAIYCLFASGYAGLGKKGVRCVSLHCIFSGQDYMINMIFLDLPQNLWVDEIAGRRESGLLREVLIAIVA